MSIDLLGNRVWAGRSSRPVIALSWRVEILNGAGGDPVSAEPIAQAGPAAMGAAAYQLMP